MSKDEQQKPTQKKPEFYKSKLFYVLSGVAIGLLIFSVFRFVIYQSETTHYHANFGIYADGEPIVFDSFTDFEEVAACSIDDISVPEHASHMHDFVGDAVHVHEQGVTWGAFLQNIGISVSEEHLQVREVLYPVNDGKTIVFILDGEVVNNVSNKIISDESKLLISYGIVDETQNQEFYQEISSSAPQLNLSSDPAACGGDDADSVTDRLESIYQ